MKRTLDLKASPPAVARPPFDMRRRKVRQWVAGLPLANLAELSRRLNEALGQVNAQQNSAGRLFHFLEAIGPATALVLPHLERQYAEQPLPLNEAGSRASHLAMEIQAGLLRGYRNVLRDIVPDKEQASRWRVLWHRTQLITVLHRFICYGDSLLAIYRVLHHEPPEGLWRRIHRCYRLAASHKLAGRRVREWHEGRRRSSIEHVYKRLLLSALLPTGTIAPPQQREIAATLDYWVRMVRLRPAAEGHEGILYLVRLARDMEPLSTQEAGAEALKSENSCLIDTRLLCGAVAVRQARGGKGRWWRREQDLQPDTVALLHEAWCTVRKRSEQRVTVDVSAEVAVGLSALFYLAGGKPGVVPPTRRVTTLVAEEQQIQGGQWLGKTKGADVWSSIYADAEKAKNVPVSLPTQAPAAVQHGEHEYSALPGRLVDKSEHGLAVTIARSDLRQAAIGMPVAVRPEGSDWIIGITMRLKDRGDSVELGVRRILDGAVPARLRTREGARVSPPFDVIIGLNNEGQRAVAAPAVSALRSGEPELEVGGKDFRVRRGAALVQSRYVDAFVLDLPQGDALAAIEQAAKTAAAAPRPRRAEKSAAPPPPPVSGDAREERVRRLIEKTGLGRTDAEFIVEAEMAAEAEEGHR